VPYVLGVCKGDGSVCKAGRYHYRIQLQANEKRFVEEFARALKEIGLNPSRVTSYINNAGNRTYRVKACSKAFYSWFLSLTSDDIKTFLVTKQAIGKFIKGFYESEGSLTEAYKNYHRIIMYNSKIENLDLAQSLLKKMKFKPRLNGPYTFLTHPPSGKTIEATIFQLHINGNREVKRFLSIIKPCIKNRVGEKWN